MAADIKQITIDILESVTLIVGLAGVMYVSKPIEALKHGSGRVWHTV